MCVFIMDVCGDAIENNRCSASSKKVLLGENNTGAAGVFGHSVSDFLIH